MSTIQTINGFPVLRIFTDTNTAQIRDKRREGYEYSTVNLDTHTIEHTEATPELLATLVEDIAEFYGSQSLMEVLPAFGLEVKFKN